MGAPIDVASERIDEAEVLLERDELDEAIRTARVAYKEMDPPIIGTALVHLVRVESVLAAGATPEVEDAVRDSFAELLETTKSAGGVEVGDARDINEATLMVARAAGLDEGGTP